MAAETPDFLEALSTALSRWRRRGRTGDLLPPVLDWCLGRLCAERILVVSERPGGEFTVRGSRTVDGEAVADPERSIAHFAVQRAGTDDAPTLFRDTRQDRRFRTEFEHERDIRSRSILILPLADREPRTFLYADSRFREITAPELSAPEWGIVRDLLGLALDREEDQRERRDAERRARRAKAVGDRPRENPRRRTTPPALEPRDFHGFITRSSPLIQTLHELERLAESDVPVLIEGESGTGKELLARAIHSASGRTGPFVTLHCGTVPETLVEVELFGHHEGAFTGADRTRGGLLAHAEGGTLFLDGAEQADPTLQGALLRVLETGRYRPLGGDREVDVDVRIVSATRETIDLGADRPDELRLDLFYRLAGARVRVPPLRERREDILPIVERLLTRAAGDATPPELAPGVEEALLAHEWPGNAREIENLARRLVALGEGALTEARFHEIAGTAPAAPRSEGPMRGAVDRAEREVILRALAEAGGNKSRACELLGMSRRTLYRRMQKHGIPLR